MASEVPIYPPLRSKRETPQVDAVRGFVFTSGLAWMRKQQGVVERYAALLPASMRERMTTTTAIEWVSIEEALIAYAACDALELSFEDQLDIGRAVSAANSGLIVRTIVRLVGSVASPWTALSHVDRIWRRSNRGGAIAVFQTGPRHARLEFWCVPLARSPFFVTSMRGAIGAGLEPFCERYVVTDVPDMTTSDGFALRVQW